MKYFFLIFIFSVVVYTSTAQEINIYGNITDSEGQALSGATIKYQSKLGTVADSRGNFHIKTKYQEMLALQIRFIGYKSVDTLIQLEAGIDHFIHIEMEVQLNMLPDIEITADYQNIFENYPFHIVDFTIAKGMIYILSKKGRTSYLSKAHINGTILEEHKLEGKFTQFHNSCLGGIILVGDNQCAELHELENKLFITNEFSIDYFNKYIIPCQIKHEEGLIFKSKTKHNKKIEYYKFEKDIEPALIYSIYDKDGARVAQSYYNEMIGQYYRESETSSLEDIDHGFDRENIIKDGTWNGDLLDLVISNKTQQRVVQYQSLGLTEVKSDIFVVNGEIYILDDHNSQILKMKNSLEIEWAADYDFEGDISTISDLKTQSFLKVDDKLYSIKSTDKELTIEYHSDLKYYYFTEKTLLHQGILYRLARKSIDSIRKTIFRDELNK